MQAFARVCSNGLGKPTPATKNEPLYKQEWKYPGFVMYSGEGFYSIYGFGKPIRNADGAAILGYTPNGTPHALDYNVATSAHPIHVPCPEIVKIEATIQKELYRRVNIHWNCFSYKQLEYMTPYFLVPGISVIIEWGWNHFNPTSLLDLTDEEGLSKLWDNPYPLYTDNILSSKGNYDVTFGIISNFEWSIEGNVIKCNTEVTSKDRMYAGISSDDTIIKSSPSVSVVDTGTSNKQYNPDWFTNLTTICNTNFITNIQTLADLEGPVDDVKSPLGSSAGGADLISLCKRLTAEKKESYWRGMFRGRVPGKNNKTGASETYGTTDFDATLKEENIWVNLGFLVEMMNYCVPLSSVSNEKRSFFQVDVDDCVIGAHPNLISTNGSTLLIPNGMSPRYSFNNIDPNNKDKQFAPEGVYLSDEGEGKDPLWKANFQLTKTFHHGRYPRRVDLCAIINKSREEVNDDKYDRHYPDCYSFPFKDDSVVISGVKFGKYKYGFFKDLYFNVKSFITIVNSVAGQKERTYLDVYAKIFEEINKASAGFWDLALVDSTGRAPDNNSPSIPTMKVVDTRMIPVRNGDDKPYYFNYGEADSIIQSISFKPALTTAQATRTMFSSQNNPDAKFTIASNADLLDYQFKDRLMMRREEKQTQPSEVISTNGTSQLLAIQKERADLQKLDAPVNGSYPMTFIRNKGSKSVQQPPTVNTNVRGFAPVGIMPVYRQGGTEVSSPPASESDKEYVRLVLPSEQFLKLLLADGDEDNNSRYIGIQPQVTAELRLLGIGGIRTFQMFFIRNLPAPYSEEDIVFRVVDVQHDLEGGNWTTLIRAGIIPLRGSIRTALGLPPRKP
jgi:hypothetical protein